jgi:hypothetical protein
MWTQNVSVVTLVTVSVADIRPRHVILRCQKHTAVSVSIEQFNN